MGTRSIKRGAALLIGLALAFGLAGCNKDGDSSTGEDLSRSMPDSGSDVSASAPADESDASGDGADASGADIDASDSQTQPADPPPATTAASVEVAAGKFVCLNEQRYADERAPYLELAGDGTAVFRLNSGMGQMGDASGPCAISGRSLSLTIDDLGVDERFRGDGADNLTFTVLDADHLRFSGEAFGLTLSGDIFTREGAGEYDPTAVPPPADPSSAPADDSSLPVGDSAPPVATDSSGATSTSSPAAATSQGDAPDADAPTIIGPGGSLPLRVKVGESFTLTGIDPETVATQPPLFDIFVEADGQSATLTAAKAGETELSFTSVGQNGSTLDEQYTITVTKDGVSPILLIIVGAIALIAGSGATFVLLSARKKRSTKTEGEDGEATEGGKSKESRELQMAKKSEAKAAKEAKQAQQNADKTAKAAAKAAAAAEKSAAKAAKAEEALAKAEAAYQLYREAEVAASKAALEAKNAVRAAAEAKSNGSGAKAKPADDVPAKEPVEKAPAPPAEKEAPKASPASEPPA
ncbi:hypothetical protein LJC60_05465, partial [Ruminococcaceae bacterium OttesenSCG-928-D13]|nr:hypothetical protein [Ruminococcaceae bacterium OttesenSCG-928-D13]